MKYLCVLLLSGCNVVPPIFPSDKPETMYDPPPMGYTATMEMHSKDYLAFYERFRAMGMSDGEADEQARRMEKLR